ncbi:19758_t:CDS:2, partial [Gigaspora rosea]
GQFIVRTAIPEYDNSAMTVTPIGVAPSSDPTKNSPSELNLSISGNGAFSNITYLILTDTDGGVAPPSSECGTKFPNGNLYSEPIFAIILYYYK